MAGGVQSKDRSEAIEFALSIAADMARRTFAASEATRSELVDTLEIARICAWRLMAENGVDEAAEHAEADD